MLRFMHLALHRHGSGCRLGAVSEGDYRAGFARVLRQLLHHRLGLRVRRPGLLSAESTVPLDEAEAGAMVTVRQLWTEAQPQNLILRRELDT